ncbi:dipeptide/oligopeptide/nickel ABC transporter ATP-binding protein [Clostridium sp. chh4-2]|uniref:ABC transporter ATP-binding protein n=1 Tax=Clostridium sp. chh4-2 TaxID=2067550 RepID=UPI000CCF1BD6|nr:ABC transporter ATP-binding protein [Clostridium sp. chh4-2]PNV61366.1 dipeptide/oligopeptide/nickel ABC transporter ATP-binding protein [Clostridium sp. chh4-2]
MSENTKNNMPFLSVKDLVVEYKSDDQIVHAVNGVSINLERGRTLGLVGETGAGKTTIAKSILQILPDIGCKIAGGKIWLDGEDVLAMPEHDLRKIRGNKVSMIFQDPMTALNPVQRVGEQIAEVIRLHNDGKTDCEARAKEMLEIVGIPAERYYEYPHQFSGGMKQRVVIAIALACNPDLLLADEPTTALDVTIQAQVMDLIGDLQKKYNTAMLLITHDMGVVAQVCNDVAVIYAGNIVEYGTKEQIFDHPSHPYTIGLFGAIPDMNEDEIWLHPIEGLPPDPTDLPKGCAFSPRCKYATDECRKEPISICKTEDGHDCRCCRLGEIKEQEG